MSRKILVVEDSLGTYGLAVSGLGKTTNSFKHFFKSPKDFILVMFTGGADVDPTIYNDTSPLDLCCTSPERDRFERTIFRHALINNIPMIGICRGFQFLNVMAGGRLMHHITGHGGTTHPFDSYGLKTSITVNSFHHQMVIPNADSHLMGWSVDKRSEEYYGKNDEIEEWGGPEVEAAIFPKVKACGVQYHPEWMPSKSDGYMFFFNLANRLLEWPINSLIQFYTEEGKNAKQKSDDVRSRFNCVA